MVDFAEHRKALLCNDAQSIADYESAMGEAVKAVSAWLQNEKCTQAVALKSCVQQFLSTFKRRYGCTTISSTYD